jgi:alpha-ketoglutarate-dependent 2,4-dichlorophenoxyacetate dioxygenase
MAISIRQIHPVFAGEVSGVDLRQPLTPSEVAAIEEGMDRHAILVFHDQNITDEQQIAFSRNFGEIENSYGGTIAQPNKRLNPLMNDVSNLGQDHTPLARRPAAAVQSRQSAVAFRQLVPGRAREVFDPLGPHRRRQGWQY